MTRQDTILKLIVEHFIKTAEPVGSKTLVEEYGLQVSTATVRNEMNALEKAGYLEKPHASAGRVPSERGYAYYNEHLKDASTSVQDDVKNAIARVLDEKTKSVEEVLNQSCEILSNLTSLASAVLGSKADVERLVSVQAIPIAEKTATCVFVTSSGYVENKTFVLPEGLNSQNLAKSVEMLSGRLSGTPVGEVPGKMEALKPILLDYLIGNDAVYQAVLEAFVRFASDRMKTYGKQALFGQPEFSEDAEKLKKLIGFLDNPAAVSEAIARGEDIDGVSVSIGGKEGLEDLAIVSAELNLPGSSNASLSVLGPKRMDYARVSAILRYMAAAIDDYFKGSAKKGE